MTGSSTMRADSTPVVPLSQAIAPVAMLMGGVPVLTGLLIAAVRYVTAGSI